MKILKWIMKAVVALVTIITLIVVFSDELKHTYNKLTWTPPMEINGITIGMTRSDVVFKLGESEWCRDEKSWCGWNGGNQVGFKDELTYLQNTSSYDTLRSIPFKNTADMKSLLGDEDILGESKDFSTRRYTYLKWGITFEFKNDALIEYMMGEVTWRQSDPIGKYIIKGNVICPGTECPFDDEGDVKEDFKDRNYTYFIE